MRAVIESIIRYIRFVVCIVLCVLFYMFCIMENPVQTAYEQEAEEKRVVIEEGEGKLPTLIARRLANDETGRTVAAYLMGEYGEYFDRSEINSDGDAVLYFISSDTHISLTCYQSQKEIMFVVRPWVEDGELTRVPGESERTAELQRLLDIQNDVIFVVGLCGNNNKNPQTGRPYYDYADRVGEALYKTCSYCQKYSSDTHDFTISNVKFSQNRHRYIVDDPTLWEMSIYLWAKYK